MTETSSPVGPNWAGTHDFRAPGVLSATSVADVQHAVRHRTGRLRALGTRHSFHDLADSDGVLVDVLGIDPDPVLDVAARTVTVGGGIRYGVLATWLDERGWALHNMGSLPHISIAGATATGTHGSGDRLGSLATAVRALEFVGADGELHVLRAGDADFAGSVVHLGAIGIVTRITLAVEPRYEIRQDVYAGLPWERLLDDFDTITGAGYSVSVFTTWTAPRARNILRKTRIDGGSPVVGDELAGAHRIGPGEIFDADNWTPQDGSIGSWASRLPHFRLDATPSVGAEIQSEYFVSRSAGPAALAAVRELGADIDEHLFVTELRTIAADDLWLSGAFGRDTLAIHFTWQLHPEPVRALLPRIEAALEPFAPRPHWGKWHTVPADVLAERYARFADARELFARLDPDGVFTNAHLERLGLADPRR